MNAFVIDVAQISPVSENQFMTCRQSLNSSFNLRNQIGTLGYGRYGLLAQLASNCLYSLWDNARTFKFRSSGSG